MDGQSELPVPCRAIEGLGRRKTVSSATTGRAATARCAIFGDLQRDHLGVAGREAASRQVQAAPGGLTEIKISLTRLSRMVRMGSKAYVI